MPHPPNILWILTTQWRARAFGFAGDPNARTPHLDAFAAESANFAQAVTPHPFGPFARAALLTGLHCPENGVRGYFDPLPPASKTVAHMLSGRGYETAFFGKWHLAPRDPHAPLVGESHAKTVVPPEFRGGFEFWEGFESGFLLNAPWLHGTRLPEPTRFSGYQSDLLCARAADWIRARNPEAGSGSASARSWFVVVSLEAPHPPYAAPASGVRIPRPEDLVLPANVPRGGEVEQRARRELAGCYAHVEATDRAIGRLLESVRGTNAVIVFTSVHGDMHGAHGLFRKGWPYEESVRVPLLVRSAFAIGGDWRGTRHEPVSIVDLARWTLLWADGGEPRIDPDSVQKISMPSIVDLPHQCDKVWRGVRTARRKLVLVANDAASSGWEPWLHFDLETDPNEAINLARDPLRRREVEELGSRI